ncbi:MAG: TetR/AcrR family transcriptional regulator [Candidatus Binatia bacterium]
MKQTSVPRNRQRRGPGRPPYDSAETREALMDAAEKLFASDGIEGVSIRSINAAAGLAPVAVHYHFGTKDRLLEAVILRRGRAVAQRARELIDAMEAEGKPPSAAGLVRLATVPYCELLTRDPVGGARWLRLLAQLVLAEDPRLSRLNAGPRGLDERIDRFVRWALPDVPKPLLEMAWRIAFSIVMLMLGNSEARIARRGDGGRRASTDYINTLVELVAIGFAGVLGHDAVGKTGTPRRAAKGRGGGR